MRSALKIHDLLVEASERLGRAGVAEPRFDADLLLARLLGTDRGGVQVRRGESLDAEVGRRFEHWLCRREQREPLQHITGVREFHGLEFRVDRRALVPRPETEGLVDAALDQIRRREGLEGANVADLGTGSGCIAISLAVRDDRARLHALDLSTDALDLARENARAHGVLSRIDFREGDFAAPPAAWQGMLDVVITNPPYVSEQEWAGLEPEVRDHDPKAALVPGARGIEAYPLIAAAGRTLLRRGGSLIAELGYGQAAEVREIVAAAGFESIEIGKDLRGIERVLVARSRARP
jgi:release factor glutamine methyltransferase